VTITPDAPVAKGYDPETATTWEKAKHFASELWGQVNPVSAVKGMAEAAQHPIDTLTNDADVRNHIYAKAADKYGKGEYASGLAHGIYASIPLLGPNMDHSADQFEKGDYAGGAGSSLGQGVAMAAPEAVKGVKVKLPGAQGAAESLYQSALKPSTRMGMSKMQGVVQTGLREGIPVSPQGLEKLTTLVDDLNTKIKAQIETGADRGVTVDPKAVAERVNQVKGKFTTQVNPEADLAAIDTAKQEFLRNNKGSIPANEAQALKTGTYQQLRGKYGQLSSATVEAQKALARGIKEELTEQFPELKDLNSREAQLIQLEPSLQKALARQGNHQLIGIGTPIAGAAAKAVTGSTGMGGAAAILKMVLDDPMVKSKLALALGKAGKGMSIRASEARVAAYSEALGSALTQEQEQK
jgi:hypothetical protein